MKTNHTPTSMARWYDKNKPWKHLYDRAAWKRLRLAQLTEKPFCWMCERAGILTVAPVVDHVIPHKGNEALFFDPGNLASLCKPHHDSSKQKAEKRGVQEIGCSEDGAPLDPSHHWNK